MRGKGIGRPGKMRVRKSFVRYGRFRDNFAFSACPRLSEALATGVRAESRVDPKFLERCATGFALSV